MVQFQNSILEHLHYHTFSNMIFNRIFKAHCAWILSCFGPKVCARLQLINLFSLLISSPNFSTSLWTWFGLSHPSIASILSCIHTHLIDFMGIHLLHCTHGNPWCSSQHLCCHCARCWLPHGVKTIICASFNHTQL